MRKKKSLFRSYKKAFKIMSSCSATVSAEILRREGERWTTEIVQGPGVALSLNSVPLAISMASLYEGLPLPETAARQRGSF
jgi:hypothetical protein